MSVYEVHRIKDPRLPFIFHVSTVLSSKHPQIGENWHENLELLLITEGNGTALLNGRSRSISQGDILVINPHVMHRFSVIDCTLSYHCLIIDRSFCLANFFDTDGFWFDECFRDAEMETALQALSAFFSKKELDTASVLKIRSLVLGILSILSCKHGQANADKQEEASLLSGIKQAIGLIRSEYKRDLSLDEAAAAAGISKYYFAREFHRLTDCTFVEYVNLLRCEEAKRLLLHSDQTVADVGLACGFQNRAYFSNTFRRYMQCTPGEFRKNNKKSR